MAIHVQRALLSNPTTSVHQYRFSGTFHVDFFQARSHLFSTSTAAFLKRPFFRNSSVNCPFSSCQSPMWCTATASNKAKDVERVRVMTSDVTQVDEMELPPLVSSTVIPGLPPPPLQASFSVLHATKERLKKTAELWNVQSFEFWTHPGISFTNGVYGATSSKHHFVAIATLQTLSFMLDDLFCDAPNDLVLEEFGISRSVRESSQKLADFFKHLNCLFRRDEILPNPTPIEGIIWELGQDMRRLSNPEWFNRFADCLLEHQVAGVSSHADHIAGEQSYLKDLEAYTKMRVLNSGGRWVMMLVEFARNVFFCDELSAHPTLLQLTDEAIIHCMYVNDLFSYPKEMFEQNPRNLIMLLMENSNNAASGLPQAAWKAVDLINAQTHIVTELEKTFDPEVSAVRTYIDGVKGVMTGNIYYHSGEKRYRHPDSVFPELRDNFN